MTEEKTENAQASTAEYTRYSDSIEAAAGATGRSEKFLQRVKAMGCPAFRGSRVYLDELEDYIEENQLNSLEAKVNESDDVDIAIRRERLRKLQIANDIEAGKYLKKEDIGPRMLALGLEVKAVLRKKLEDEYPERQAQRSREEILIINRQLIDEICELFQRGIGPWSKS